MFTQAKPFENDLMVIYEQVDDKKWERGTSRRTGQDKGILFLAHVSNSVLHSYVLEVLFEYSLPSFYVLF